MKETLEQQFFSIIIPVYNVAEYIDTCLQSILVQTYTSFEVIIVDDASTDSTVEKIQKYTDARIRLIRHTENMGPGAARNTAIRNASGTWLVCVDGDDWIAPTRLQELYSYIQKNRVDIVADNNYLITNESTISEETLFKKTGIKYFEKPISLSYLLTHTPAIHPSIRASFLKENDLWFLYTNPGCEDYGLWVRSILSGACIHLIEKPLYFYRQRNNGLSSDAEKILKSLYLNTQEALSLAKDSVSKQLLKKKIYEIKQKIAVRTAWKSFISQKNFLTFVKLFSYTPFVISFFSKKFFQRYV